jgi:saccharopine dehydrogenase-like NADP-dependent oxidoreductase
MARWGEASRVILADFDLQTAHRAATRLEKLTGKEIFHPVQVDVRDPLAVERILSGSQSALSAVPYYYNLDITGRNKDENQPL